ncbi:MAG TPA: polymorphic toxin type 44 domain-containing protein [Candidatus Dormibacteraeota bacterium]|nr:polymorphic toxin type 44 domain-containing protein [Candidatus Dormibacteraeota bacterium]
MSGLIEIEERVLPGAPISRLTLSMVDPTGTDECFVQSSSDTGHAGTGPNPPTNETDCVNAGDTWVISNQTVHATASIDYYAPAITSPQWQSVTTPDSLSPLANLKGRCFVPNHPATANVNANVSAGKNNVGQTDNPDIASTQFGFEIGYLYGEFHTGGPQDYKTSDGPQYADFGNFNFGAVCGGMGFSLTYCHSAAGLGLMGRVAFRNSEYALHISSQHEQYNGAGIPFLTPPFGDQPADSAEISAGYAYQAAGCVQ